jgi:hypothetical protein
LSRTCDGSSVERDFWSPPWLSRRRPLRVIEKVSKLLSCSHFLAKEITNNRSTAPRNNNRTKCRYSYAVTRIAIKNHFRSSASNIFELSGPTACAIIINTPLMSTDLKAVSLNKMSQGWPQLPVSTQSATNYPQSTATPQNSAVYYQQYPTGTNASNGGQQMYYPYSQGSPQRISQGIEIF